VEALIGTDVWRATGLAADLQALEVELRAADDARIIAEERTREAETHLRDQRASREHAGMELDRFERELAVTSEEQTLYAEEKQQLVTRRDAAVAELKSLEQRESDTHEHIRATEERLASARSEFERVTHVPPPPRA